MTLASHLPIYKASYDLILHLFEIIHTYPRTYKYTLGEQLKQETLTLILTITKANILRDKKPLLEQARGSVESIRLLLRLSKDLHLLSLEKFVEINSAVESISKQLVAWSR